MASHYGQCINLTLRLMDLVLNTYGSTLSRDLNGFVITSGGSKQRIPSEGITSIQVSNGAMISSDAVLFAIENEIEIMFTSKGGSPMGRVWSPKYGSISTIRKGQLAFLHSHDALNWITGILSRKIENQQALLLAMHSKDDVALENKKIKAIDHLEKYRTKMLEVEGDFISDVAPLLRGIEGQASKIYFECMNLFLPERFRFEERSQHPAMDVPNALLNYGYGMMYSKIEGALIKSGIDPYIGILHSDNYNRPVLAYDVIEIYRVWVDYVVYSLLCQNIITDEFYSVREDGSYWLEPLGRRVLIQSLNDYLEEIVGTGNFRRSRITQIFLFCQDLAQTFKKFETI